MTLVNLASPVRSERVRAGFQPHWRTVYVYRCENGHETRVFASAFRGTRAEPAVGAISCPQCEHDAASDDPIIALCKRAAAGDQAARATLYDHHGINDEDRAAILAHQTRASIGW